VFFKDSQEMSELSSDSVQLVVTSPPYWSIKDYGNPLQLGYSDSLDAYFSKLGRVFSECIRVLSPGCRLCVNIGDQYLRATSKTPYQIIPLHATLVTKILKENSDVIYLGSIIWRKISTTNTSGGASVMGSYGYPRNGYVSYNFEYIAIFKKKGKSPKIDFNVKAKSKISLEDWRTMFNGIWSFNGVKQINHMAMFPEELPKRLINMFSFEGDVVLDPFLGSGTTSKVAYELGRSSVGYEIGFSNDIEHVKQIIRDKIHFYDVPLSDRKSVFPTLI